jgi:tripartite-type tricarboxylate transporter receptor subunit TctC
VSTPIRSLRIGHENPRLRRERHTDEPRAETLPALGGVPARLLCRFRMADSRKAVRRPCAFGVGSTLEETPSMKISRAERRRLLAALLATSLPLPTRAQSGAYPNRPVRLVVGFTAGGAADLVTRISAQGLTEQLHQTFIVDNRPGAAGSIAAQNVLGSPPDGYQLFSSSSGAITLEPNIRKQKLYDPLTAFVPVVMMARFPFILVAGKSQPFDTGPQLLAYAKAHPGKVSYASAGNGTLNHLGCEYFKMKTGTDLVHIPYKGDAGSIGDLMNGTVSINMLTAPVAIPLVQGGKLKAIGTMDDVRTPTLPEVSTLAEQGMPGFEIGSWIGLFAATGTPTAIVDEINHAVSAFFATAAGKSQLAAGSMRHDPMSPAQFDTMIRKESARWAEVAHKANITIAE